MFLNYDAFCHDDLYIFVKSTEPDENAALCGISYVSSLFVKVPVCGIGVSLMKMIN